MNAEPAVFATTHTGCMASQATSLIPAVLSQPKNCQAERGSAGTARKGHPLFPKGDVCHPMDSIQVLNIPSRAASQLKAMVMIEGPPCMMHLDTGSPISIISAKTLQQLCPRRSPPLRPASFIPWDFRKQAIALKGVGNFKVEFKSHQRELDLVIVEGPYVS